MPSYIIDLSISPEEIRRYYSGQVSMAQAKTRCGLTLRFDARHLRKHLTPNGIHGRFCLKTSDENRFIALEKLD